MNNKNLNNNVKLLIKKPMKTFITKLLLMMGILCCFYGCSSDESIDSRNVDLNDLIMDENIGEEWNGTGVPSWLSNRFFNFVNEETEWLIESYWGVTQCNVYKFNYKNNLLLVLDYNRFGHRNTYYNTSGKLCFTKDGRRVKFDDIKSGFENAAELVWTNKLGSKGQTIEVADSKLTNASSLSWLQQVINQTCENVKEPDQVLSKIAYGYANDGTNTYIVLDYDYFDKNNLGNGEISVRNVYTTNGEKIDTPKNLKTEELCTQRIIDFWASH